MYKSVASLVLICVCTKVDSNWMKLCGCYYPMTWHFFSVTFGALYIAVPSGLLDLTCAWQVPHVP